MPTRPNQLQGRVFTTISDTNTPSAGLDAKAVKMRAGQRSGLYRMGVPKKLIRKIIRGGE